MEASLGYIGRHYLKKKNHIRFQKNTSNMSLLSNLSSTVENRKRFRGPECATFSPTAMSAALWLREPAADLKSRSLALQLVELSSGERLTCCRSQAARATVVQAARGGRKWIG